MQSSFPNHVSPKFHFKDSLTGHPSDMTRNYNDLFTMIAGKLTLEERKFILKKYGKTAQSCTSCASKLGTSVEDLRQLVTDEFASLDCDLCVSVGRKVMPCCRECIKALAFEYLS